MPTGMQTRLAAALTILAVLAISLVAVREKYFFEPMLKRNEMVAISERKCGIKPFSTFIMREKGILNRGIFDYYSGSRKVSLNEMADIAKENDDKINNLESNILLSSGFYGNAKNISCMDAKMAGLGYDRRNPLTDMDKRKYSWLILDKAI